MDAGDVRTGTEPIAAIEVLRHRPPAGAEASATEIRRTMRAVERARLVLRRRLDRLKRLLAAHDATFSETGKS